MADLRFTIHGWLERDHGTEEERGTFALLEVNAGGTCLTEVFDRAARTTRPAIRVSLFPLADWLLWNRWRLLYEPEARSESSWRMAHEVGAAGGGFLWPRLSLSSDGETVTLRQQADPPHEGMVRYLNGAEVVITLAQLERAVDELVEQVVARLAALGTTEGHLHGLLQVVRQERSDPALSQLRRDEALLGLDPDEVESSAVRALRAAAAWAGPAAADEVLEHARYARAAEQLRWLSHASSAPPQTLDLSELERFADVDTAAGAPWERGVALARRLREGLGLGLDRINLEDLVHVKLGRPSSWSPAPLTAGFVGEGGLRAVGCALRRRGAGARFEVARLVCDALLRPASDQVLPVTDSATARQKVQRAFAQELLSPIEGIVARVSLPYPDDGELEAAAEHYGVSEFAVRSALVNRGYVGREYLPERW